MFLLQPMNYRKWCISYVFVLFVFFYLSSYSDLRLKFGQFFLVHSAVSKEIDRNTR